MARESTLNVSLTDALKRYVNSKIATGNYESASEVVRESLRLSQSLEQRESLYWTAVREKVSVARRQVKTGQVVDGEVAMKTLISELGRVRPTKKRKKRIA